MILQGYSHLLDRGRVQKCRKHLSMSSGRSVVSAPPGSRRGSRRTEDLGRDTSQTAVWSIPLVFSGDAKLCTLLLLYSKFRSSIGWTDFFLYGNSPGVGAVNCGLLTFEESRS